MEDEKDPIADLRMLINDEKFLDKESFYKFINLLKVLPEWLEMAKSKN